MSTIVRPPLRKFLDSPLTRLPRQSDSEHAVDYYDKIIFIVIRLRVIFLYIFFLSPINGRQRATDLTSLSILLGGLWLRRWHSACGRRIAAATRWGESIVLPNTDDDWHKVVYPPGDGRCSASLTSTFVSLCE